MARIGAPLMAQNTQKTELILTFEKKTWYIFGLKDKKKHSLCCDLNPLPTDSVDFINCYQYEKNFGILCPTHWAI